MNQHINEQECLFKTSRLIISDVCLCIDPKPNLLSRITELLTPQVVKSLPSHFQDISSPESADIWLSRMLSESRCLAVKSSENNLIIGFIFLYESNDGSTHIGYLLGEDYWGHGYAKEFLNALIAWCRDSSSISKLIGGVEPDNVASASLLKKLGFVECSDKKSAVVFYEYTLT